MKKLLTIIYFLLLCSCGRSDKGFIEQKDIFVSGQEGSAFYRIPALVTTNNGTLIAVCDARIERIYDAPNNIDIALKRSFDNGKTWTPLEIILDYPGQRLFNDRGCEGLLNEIIDSHLSGLTSDLFIPIGRDEYLHSIRMGFLNVPEKL